MWAGGQSRRPASSQLEAWARRPRDPASCLIISVLFRIGNEEPSARRAAGPRDTLRRREISAVPFVFFFSSSGLSGGLYLGDGQVETPRGSDSQMQLKSTRLREVNMPP